MEAMTVRRSDYVPPIVYCPTCAQDTIPSRAGFCLFCDEKIVVGEPRRANGSADTRAVTDPPVEVAVGPSSPTTTTRSNVHTIDTLAATLLERVQDGAPSSSKWHGDLHSAGRYHGIRWSDLLVAAGLPVNKTGRPKKAA